MPVAINVILVINAINDIFEAIAIYHKRNIFMSIWVSIEVLGPQKLSKRLSKSTYVSSKSQKRILSLLVNFLCIFKNFLCINYEARGRPSIAGRGLNFFLVTHRT